MFGLSQSLTDEIVREMERVGHFPNAIDRYNFWSSVIAWKPHLTSSLTGQREGRRAIPAGLLSGIIRHPSFPMDEMLPYSLTFSDSRETRRNRETPPQWRAPLIWCDEVVYRDGRKDTERGRDPPLYRTLSLFLTGERAGKSERVGRHISVREMRIVAPNSRRGFAYVSYNSPSRASLLQNISWNRIM